MKSSLSIQSGSQITRCLHSPQTQRMLLVAAVACALLSVIPNLGLIGSLSLRTIACGAVGLQLAGSKENQEGKWLQRLKVMRLAGALLGLASVAAGFTPLAITALSVELAYQAAETGHGTKNRDLYKALSHAYVAVVDTFALIALLHGGWGFAVTAMTLNSVALFAFGTKAVIDAIRKREPIYALDAVCYMLLGGISIAGAVRAAELSKQVSTKFHFKFYNNTDRDVTIYDKHGEVIAVVPPGKDISFSLNPSQVDNENSVVAKGNFPNYRGTKWPYPSSKETVKVVTQLAMRTKEFAALPLESLTLVAKEPRLKEQPPTKEVEDLPLVTLKPLPPCYSYEEPGTVALIHAATGKRCTLDRQLARGLSDFIRADLDWGKEEPYELTLSELSLQTFSLLTDYLQTGMISGIELLRSEVQEELIASAEVLQLENLCRLTRREKTQRTQRRSI